MEIAVRDLIRTPREIYIYSGPALIVAQFELTLSVTIIGMIGRYEKPVLSLLLDEEMLIFWWVFFCF